MDAFAVAIATGVSLKDVTFRQTEVVLKTEQVVENLLQVEV